MAYNLTNVTDANTIVEQMIAINSLSGNFLGIFILVSAFLVQFILLKRTDEDTKTVLVVNSVLCTIEAGLLWTIGLLPAGFLIYPILLLVGSLMAFYIKKD